VQLAIFGLGYVGVVSAACLARDGHHVIGVDPNHIKVDFVNSGKSPIVEPGLENLIRIAVDSGLLMATDNFAEAVLRSGIIFVCVGTPGMSNGSLDLGFVRRVCEQIGGALKKGCEYKVVVVRSTMLPGSMESVVIPTLEAASGKRVNVEFGACINPEFLREGTAIHDFDNPPKTIIGAADERATVDVRKLYDGLKAPMFVTNLRTAEMTKYADNCWHALKVSFANEIGRLSKAMAIDSRELMRIFCEDHKLNISRAYLRPGFAFGGSCLPKDVRAVTYQGRSTDVNTPVLSAILPSNRVQIDHALSLIYATGKKQIGLLGLSFKAGTDDLRESPMVTMVERLLGKGYQVSIFDQNVRLASLVGANRDYILNHIPHIGSLLKPDAREVFSESDVIVLATDEQVFGELVRAHGGGKFLIDLVGTWELASSANNSIDGHYAGIAW